MKYLSVVIISFSISLALWVSGIYLQLGMATPDHYWVKQYYDRKEAYAKSINEQKLLLVAGSNALFGFDSNMLSEAMAKPVVNMGVHAGMGMEYILKRSKKSTNPGDIVIIPMEYSFFQADGYPSQVISDFIIAWDKDYFRGISLSEQWQIAFAINTKRFLQGLKMKNESEIISKKGVYHIQNINEYGDQINLEPAKMTAYEHAWVNAVIVDRLQSADLSQHFMDTMTAYLHWAKENEICVVAAPPNFMYFDAYQDDIYKRFFNNISEFYREQGIWFVGDAYQYMFQKEHYFNTRYHLNSVGVELRTKQLIADLNDKLVSYCANGLQ